MMQLVSSSSFFWYIPFGPIKRPMKLMALFLGRYIFFLNFLGSQMRLGI